VGSSSLVGCSTKSADPPLPASQGGAAAQGGDSSSGGRAGTGAAGGSAAGGASSGGANSSGGTASGGATSTGGAPASAGSSASGSGGTSAAGGTSGGAGSAGSPGGAAGTGGSQTGGRGGAGGAGGGSPGEYGFTYRIPGSHEFSCQNQPVAVPDADWLCTFGQGETPAYVYVQATPVDVTCALAPTGIYEVTLAQISIDGVVTSLSGAAYDWGGGHHNDSLSFDYGEKTYKYYHSSIGFGFRSCQPMDCVNVYEPGTSTPEVEGCAADRSLPEVCVPIDEQGTHEELIDEFMKCPGDTS
jgi:hypothetical protein